ncbi:MAG: hypothetical protein IKL13_02765 [Clostridia bacterium]|nr:hypothetical protein [Clostridia bacterium]
MKKAWSLLLVLCLSLCLLCSCGATDTTGGETGGENGGENGGDVAIDASAKELLGGYRYLSTDQEGDQTSTEEVITSIEWTDTGAVMTGYEQDDEGNRSDMRMEVTFDEQKRPATLVRTITDTDGEVEESNMRFEYPAERTVKMINSGFGDGESYVIYEYDEKGLLIREEYPNYTHIYAYDAHGNCVSKKTDYVDEQSTDREQTAVYTYDEDGRITYEVQTSSNGCETQTRYFYYPNGNVMMKLSVSDTGDANFNFHPYNTKDALAWSYGMSASGGMMEYTAEKDAEGRIVKVTATEPNGKTSATTFSYDAQGRLVQVINRFGEKSTWEYDAQGRLVKYLRNSGSSERVYTYDDKGRLIKEENSGSSGYRHTTTREYNEAGMVCKMVESSYYPAGELYPEGYTSTDTVEITYVENSQCHIDALWADLILKSFASGI